MVYSPWVHRVGQDSVTKPSPPAIVLEGIKEKTGKSTDDWDVGRFEEIEVLSFHR